MKIDANLEARPYLRENDFVDSLSRPHTVLVAALTFIGLLFLQSKLDYTNIPSYKVAIVASCGVFIAFASIFLPDSILVRPHPVIWRITLGIGILYMMFMTFLFFIDVDQARIFFSLIDSSLGEPLEEVLYATDCAISSLQDLWKIWDALFDEFVVAHTLGYWVKMIVVRDFWLVFALSLGFEVIECSMQFWLENFRECAWDHLLLDAFGCNLLGMLAGVWTLHYLKMKEYHWVKLKDLKGLKQKALRITLQFTPREWHVQDWLFFNSPSNTLQVLFVLGMILIQELNVFLLKHLLWLPPTHPIVIGRVCFFGVLAIPAVREFYCYCRQETAERRLGPSAWVCSIAVFMEVAVIYKYGGQTPDFFKPFPAHVRWAWMIAGCSWTTWFILRYWNHRQSKRHSIIRNITSWIFFCIPFFGFLVMCCISTPGLEEYGAAIQQFLIVLLEIIQRRLKLIGIPL